MYNIAKLRSRRQILHGLLANVDDVVDNVRWMLLFVVNSDQDAILLKEAEHSALTLSFCLFTYSFFNSFYVMEGELHALVFFVEDNAMGGQENVSFPEFLFQSSWLAEE